MNGNVEPISEKNHQDAAEPEKKYRMDNNI
jgi:hypothetical protein